MNGTLAIKITSCTPTHTDESTNHLNLGFQIKIGSEIKNSNPFHPSDSVDQMISFDLKDATGDDEALIEAHLNPKKSQHDKVAADYWKVPLLKLFTPTWTSLHLSKADSYSVELESKWTVKDTMQKLAGKGAAHTVNQGATEGFVAIHRPPVPAAVPQAFPPVRKMLGAIVTQLEAINSRLDSMDGRLHAIEDGPVRPLMTTTMEAIADKLDDAVDELENINSSLGGMETRLEAIEDHLG